MKLRSTLLITGLLVVSLLLVSSVFASHEWYLEGVDCFPEDNQIVISGYLGDGTSFTQIYVDGNFLRQVEGPISAFDNIQISVTDPAFVDGAEIFVEVYGEGRSASTTCGDDSDVADNGQFFDPGDDRINRQAYAPIAIYCAETRLEILSIDADGNGTPAIILDFASMPATPTDENLLVETTGNGLIKLYRLTSGEWVATAGPDAEGKTYMLLWDGCPATYIQAYIQWNGVTTPTEVFPR